MRTKQLVPVGQGCKRYGMKAKQFGTDCGTRCMCHPELYLLVCKGCWENFHSPMPHTRTCSDKCRKRLSRSKGDKMLQRVLAFANAS